MAESVAGAGTIAARAGVHRRLRARLGAASGPLAGHSLAVLYLSIVVLLPLAAVVSRSLDGGPAGFWHAVTRSESLAALELTVLSSLIVVAINAVLGTLVAWVLVRDRFPGRRAVNAIIDLPFALPTIVAGLTLLALYGNHSPVGIDVAFTRAGVVLALLFVTLPFVVRAVQPLLLELDREMEEAAASLGARRAAIFRLIVLPNLLPGIGAGVALAFARALGEYGSLVLISGNVPFKTEVSSVYIRGLVESGETSGAAAVSVVLLAVSLLLLAAVGVAERRGRSL